MQLMLRVVSFCLALIPYYAVGQSQVMLPSEQHMVYFEVGGQIVFDSVAMANSTLTVYPNQLIFSVMDGEGQHVSLTFAGKDISQRKPEVLSFDEPGLFHGYSESGDVFFISYGKFVGDREPGQIKYDTSLPQNIMEGKLRVISWTKEGFVFEFEGKLGEGDAAGNPESWVPFSGRVESGKYQKFEM